MEVPEQGQVGEQPLTAAEGDPSYPDALEGAPGLGIVFLNGAESGSSGRILPDCEGYDLIEIADVGCDPTSADVVGLASWGQESSKGGYFAETVMCSA